MPYRDVLVIAAMFGSLAGAGAATAQDASRLPYQKPDARPNAALKAGANSFIESQARELLEAKGYSDISKLVNDSDGIWRGTAKRNDLRVDVSVDFQGHVAEK